MKLINSFSVKQNREQQLMRREKTDQINVAAIGDLLRRSEGTAYKPPASIYMQLQQIGRVRLGKLKIANMLKSQILGHLDRIFPGLMLISQTAQECYTPLFNVNFWQCQTLHALIRICPNPYQLVAMSPDQMVQAFHA